VRDQLADQLGVPVADIDVVAPTIGASDADTQHELDQRLNSYLDMRDPEHPDRTYEALSIQYLSGDGTAVTDSCYPRPRAPPIWTTSTTSPCLRPQIDPIDWLPAQPAYLSIAALARRAAVRRFHIFSFQWRRRRADGRLRSGSWCRSERNATPGSTTSSGSSPPWIWPVTSARAVFTR
jgi:hypothetical protein